MKILLAALIASLCGTSSAMNGMEAKGILGIAYYFPKSDICTIMIDYQPSVARVRQAKSDAKSILLASSMLNEYAANGAQKCKSAPTVRMLAVLIPGKDSYGRPDFGSRTNLLKLEGRADKLEALATGRDHLSLPMIQSAGSLHVY